MEAVMLHQKVGSRAAFDIAKQALADVGIADPHRRMLDLPAQHVRRHATARYDCHGTGLQAQATHCR
jgi:hypothetical protein